MISITSPIETRAHRWPSGPKIAGLCAAGVILFALGDWRAQAGVLAIVAGLYALPGRAFLRAGAARIRPLWPFLAIVLAWAAWDGRPAEGAAIALRLVNAVALANLVTMTTRITDMTAAIGRAAAPLGRLGLPVGAFEMAVALVIRMVPVLGEKAAALSEAWRARSPRRAGWRIVVPLMLIAYDDADHVAEAIRARGGLDPIREPERT